MTTLVLLLHGVGSNGADLAGLVRYFQPVLPDGVFDFPDAPNAFGPSGTARQWFSVSGITDANRPARVVAARAGLDALIDASVAQTKARDVVLIGFSQGAIMALDALARGKVAKVVAFAGRLAFDDTPTPAPKARALLIGGTADQVMPHRFSTQAGARLSAAGVKTQVVILADVAHTITAEGIALAQGFLAKD